MFKLIHKITNYNNDKEYFNSINNVINAESIYIYIYIYMLVYVCMCVCVCACMCIKLSSRLLTVHEI